MKKYVEIIAVLLCLCLCLCLCACNNKPPKAHNATDISANAPDQPVIFPFHYDSLIDFKNSLCKEETLYAELSEKGVKSETVDEFKVFVEKLRSKNIIVPYLNGEVIELRNEEGYSGIALFASELYGLPWIFYHPSVSTSENFYIKITCLPDNIIGMQKNTTASDVIKELSPNSPNINNLGTQHEKIYNQKIKLSDREVTALVCEYKTDNRNSIIFIYDGFLVEVRCDPQVWNAQWFSSLSFDSFDK